MLIVVEWLNEYLSEPLGSARMASALEAAGIEVEDTTRPPEFNDKIVAATVEEVKPHPNADKLRLAIVNTGNKQYEIVCGAPNLYEGQRAVLAQVGAQLPDGTDIQETDIRGQTSHGMLCSEYELGLGGAHEGIMDLGPEVEPGTPLHAVYSDNYTLIDVDTPTNRWDIQSYVGIAREVAAHSEVDFIFDVTKSSDSQGERSDALFENHVQDEVPSYGLVQLTLPGKQVPDSPSWMQRRLRFHGVKPMNGVVDITNYAMLVTGQPLHAFDGDVIEGGIQIRYAGTDEAFATLDGVERTLSSNDLVIADDSGPIALAGVIGGSRSEISAQTNTITLEAASFEGVMVRKTAKRHGLRTEASARFERGIPMKAVKHALRYAVGLLQEYTGAEVRAYQTERAKWPWVQHIGVPTSRAAVLSGVDGLSREDIAGHLQKLQFEARPFDVAAEARSHLGKPYKWGASFKTDGTEAFDCSYLIDYLYSLINVHVGHTALGQYELGTPVEKDELRPGDVVFYEGKIEHSATDHYYTRNGDLTHTKHALDETKKVGHNGIYVGEGKVVMAAEYRYEDGEWVKREEQGVIEVELSEFTENGGYLGARRYVENLDDYVTVTVPWWRPDVTMLEDIIEEVVKLIGLDEIPSTLPKWQPQEVAPDEYWHRLNEIRWLLYGLGLFEVTTYPFISEDDITTFHLDKEHLKLANPRSQEQAYLRTTVLPLLVKSIAHNTGYVREFGIFEIARVFFPETEQQLPTEQIKLGIAMKTDSVLKLKGYLDQLVRHIHGEAEIESGIERVFGHPARQAHIRFGRETAGWFGEVHPDILTNLKSRESIMCAEIDITTLLRHWQPARFHQLPKYQSSYRDITILVPPRAQWQDLHRSVEQVKDVEATFVDEYHKEGKKAVTIHLELLARDATLTDAKIRERVERITQILKTEHGAEISS